VQKQTFNHVLPVVLKGFSMDLECNGEWQHQPNRANLKEILQAPLASGKYATSTTAFELVYDAGMGSKMASYGPGWQQP
jgi:hypothetical protein